MDKEHKLYNYTLSACRTSNSQFCFRYLQMICYGNIIVIIMFPIIFAENIRYINIV